MIFTFTKTKKVLATTFLVVTIFTICLSSAPRTSYAIGGVPITTSMDFQSTMNYRKNFTLDKIATMIAKQILHKLTASVVNWINTGFKGSPSFLTNPGAFFLDAADQITGAFLATNGPLSSLCSPFSIDIRLSLALSQTTLLDQRYTCTLSKIIEAQKNGPDITVNGKVINSSSGSMNGFLGGDFNQGGWPAFLALTTEPQNNPHGAFLSAQGDLYARIGQRQNTIKADLQLGQGFMSWETCKDVPGGTFDASQEGEAAQMAFNDPSMTVKANKDGTQTFQNCETQTPGSVISGTLQTNLNVPVKELELANDINAVVNALVTQMMNSLLSSGLRSLSGGSASGSGGGVSYTQQIIDDANGTQAQASLDNLQSQISWSIEQIDNYESIYRQAVEVLTDSQNRYITAKTCYAGRPQSTTIQNTIANIDYKINNEVIPRIDVLKTKQSDAAADRGKLEDISFAISGTGSTENVQIQMEKYNKLIQTGELNVKAKIDTANSTLTETQLEADKFNADSATLMGQCSSAF